MHGQYFITVKKLYGRIPSDLFAHNLNLRDCSSMFSGCIGLVGTIPETLFTNSSGANYTH